MRGHISDQQMPAVAAGGFGFKKKLELAPGQYLLRFVVRDDLTGRIGSLSAPFTVN